MTAETVAEPTPWDGLWFKALRAGRRATHAPDFVWPEPGIWLEVGPGPLVACEHGLHVATLPQIMSDWLSEELWLVEPVLTGAVLNHEGTKTVVRRARLVEQLPWDERSARLFAADCAERVLPIFERERPGDDRPRLAIDHLCRNRACVNPDHMEAVPQGVNTSRGRGPSSRYREAVACINGHAFDEANTYRWTNRKGTRGRFCRKCRATREARRKAQLKARMVVSETGEIMTLDLDT